MEDDIDIEEHDILQYPQIKNLFSEYTQVKLEYDADDSIVEDEHMQLIDQEPGSAEDPATYNGHEVILPDYPNHILFGETQNVLIESIEIPKDTPDEVPENYEPQEMQEESDMILNFEDGELYREDGDILPSEDIYHCNNKIILGTKHKPQYSARFDVQIVLEDCMDKLENCQTFCKECGILFPTVNTLDDHKMTCHSLLVAVTNNVAHKSTSEVNVLRPVKNQARKSTANKLSKYCNHCNKEFPESTALMRHLYELLPLKQFQCVACEAVFNTQKDLILHNRVHVKVEYPESRKRLVFEEGFERKSLDCYYLPKSVIYQCSKCSVHFLTCIAAWQHFTTYCKGVSTKKIWKPCNICYRRFRCLDLAQHRKQHKLSKKIKIHKITKNLIHTTLARCPTCNVHFGDCGSMNKHLGNCGNIPTKHCSECEVDVQDTMYAAHLHKHTHEGLKPSDFHFIETFLHKRKFKDGIDKYGQGVKKNKLDPTVKTSKKFNGKRLKKQINLKVFYCQRCRACFGKPNSSNIHVKKQCIRQSKDAIVCHKCGIQITKIGRKSHLRNHNRGKFTVHNIIFVDMASNRVCPKLPFYPECKRCNIKFNNRKYLNDHECGENYETCNVCTEKFDVSTYELHLEFHKMIRNTKLAIESVHSASTEPSFDSSQSTCRKTHKNNNSLWNILYKCISCEIVTDQYDTAVEHSQNHCSISDKHSIKCYICNLKFLESCWSYHSSLHSRMLLNNADFQFLPYNPEALLTDEWFQLFEPLKSSQMSQILRRSLYSIERSVPMKLLKDGLIEYTLYSCSKCQVCFQNSEITKHEAQCYCERSSNVCSYCQLLFQDGKALKYHQLLHQGGVKFEDFRIVNFIKSPKKFTLYRCRQCKACVMNTDQLNAMHHTCSKESRYVKCLICNQMFLQNVMQSHKELHNKYPEFNRSNTQVIYFQAEELRLNEMEQSPAPNKTVTFAKTSNVYRCTCGLNFTNLISMEEHFKSCTKDVNVATQKCTKCQLLFPTDMLDDHVYRHHSINTRILIKEYSQILQSSNNMNGVDKVFKCSDCDVYFIRSKTCLNHVKNLNHVVGRKPTVVLPCDLCGLRFSKRSLKLHMKYHHVNGANTSRFIVEELHPIKRNEPLKKNRYTYYIGTDKIQSLEVSSSIPDHDIPTADE